MKMLSFLAGELSNSAAYFTTFANVNQSEANDYKKSFGITSQHSWRPFPYSKRVNDASKVAKKKELLEKEKLSDSTKHKKLLAYIGKELKSRQLRLPLIEHYIDVAKAEPLHLKNNTIKERFIILFKIAIGEMVSSSNIKCFSDLSVDSLFLKFVQFLQKQMACNFLANKIKSGLMNMGERMKKNFLLDSEGKKAFSI